MKKLIFLLCSLFVALSGYAENYDRFSYIEQTVGKKIVLYDASILYTTYGAYLYTEQKGKIKPVRDALQYTVVLSNDKVLDVVEITTIKRKNYLKITGDDGTFFLLLDPQINYCEHIRSYSFWEDILSWFRRDYQYIRESKLNPAIHPDKQYKAIKWMEFVMPDRMTSDVIFMFTEESIDPTNLQNPETHSRALPADEIFNSSSKFFNQNTYDLDIRVHLQFVERERLDSIADTRPIVARILSTYSGLKEFNKNRLAIEFKEGYLISLYEAYTTEWETIFKGYFAGTEMSFASTDLRFNNPSDAEYLKRRKSEGALNRKEVAKANDAQYIDKVLKEMQEESEKMLSDLTKIQKFYQTKRIFITGQEYIFDDYGQFGMKFNIYNPWTKQIKYIEFTLVPYNAVNDIQSDDFGRRKQTVRCIGPIVADGIGTYSFEKIYWDENGIIDRVDITHAKITFMDNSTVVYSSKSQVDMHCRSHYTLIDMGITE